jgi:signal peptide peptidase SppA
MTTHKQLPHLLSLLSQPIAMEPRMLVNVANLLRRKLAGGSFTGADLHAELEIAMPRERATAPSADDGATIAVIDVGGIISERGFSSMGTSTEQIRQQYRRALADERVDKILLDCNSPGGTVSGVPETADEILAGRDVKPTIAIAYGLAASAAYWIACAASEVWVTPSGPGVGSIGVYSLHEDWSKNLEQEGVAITALYAGKYKLEGAPWQPLSDEARQFEQDQVDEYYGLFTKFVAKARGDTAANVRGGYGQGRVLSGKHAVEAKLADKVGTFDELVARLASKKSRPGKSAALQREQLRLANLKNGS